MISWRNIAAYAPLITALLVNRLQTCRTLIRNLHKVVVAVGGDDERYLHLLAYLRLRLTLPLRFGWNDDTANLDARLHGTDFADRLLKLCIDSTPAGIIALLLDAQPRCLARLFGLHITQGGGILRHRQLLSVQFQHGILSPPAPVALIALHKGVNSIHGVHRRIPNLGALRHQEPALQFLNGLLVVRLQHLQRLYHGYLGRNLIVSPAVECLAGIVVAAHLLAVNGIFVHALQIFASLLAVSSILLAVSGEYHGSTRLAIDGEITRYLRHLFQEISLVSFQILLHLSAIHRKDVEIMQRLFARIHLLLFLLLFLHLSYFPSSLQREIVQSRSQHPGG